MSWTLNGQLLTHWHSAGLSGGRLSFRSRAADSFELEWQGLLTAALPAGFGLGDDIELAYDGDRIFLGRVVEVPREGTSSTPESRRVVAKGVWWWLENTVFQQEYRFSGADAYRLRPGYRMFVSRDGELVPTHTQITEILDYAIDCGAPISLATNPTGPQPPMQQGSNFTCAEALQRCLRWTPDVCTWCDYDTAGDVDLHLVPWATAVATPRTIAITAPELQGMSCVPRYDLQIPGVRILWENAIGTNPLSPYPTEQRHPVDFDFQQPRAVNLVLDLRGQAVVPAGLAQRYYDAFATLQHAGSLTLYGADCDLSWHPGQALRISGGLAEWATMRAQIQEVEHDLDLRSTRLVFGPPEHLSIQDLVELLLADSRSGVGYILSSGKPERSAAADFAGPPLSVIPVMDEGSPKIRVVPALVNNLIPTLGPTPPGSPITDDPAPMSGVLTDGVWTIYLEVTTDSGGIATAVSIKGTTGTVPDDTATVGRLAFSRVTIVAGAHDGVLPLRTGSQWHQRCGNGTSSSPYRHLWNT